MQKYIYFTLNGLNHYPWGQILLISAPVWLRWALQGSLGILSPRLVINFLSHSGHQRRRTVDLRCPRHAVPSPARFTMGDRSNSTQDRAFTEEDDITIVLHKVARNSSDSGDDHDECGGQGEHTAERIHLQRLESREHDNSDAGSPRRDSGGDYCPEDKQKRKTCWPRTFCVRGEPASPYEGRGATQHKS